MRYFLSALLVLTLQFQVLAQCSCTDCPIQVLSNQTTQSNLQIAGANNDQMGVNGQGLCQICINFTHDAPDEVEFVLTSPSGTSVTLIDNTGLSVNQNISFNICFVACSLPANPDPGFPAVFDSGQNWQSNTTYTGTYYPTTGCLEDLTGDINGNWNFTFTDHVGQDDGVVNDWNLIFCTDIGIGCGGSPGCLADAGTLSVNPQPACPGSTVNYSVAGYETDPAYTEVLIVTDGSGNILEVNPPPMGSITRNSCETLLLYSYNYDPTSGATVPTVGSNVNQIDCTNSCCDLRNEPISFEDTQPPVFTNPPPDLNLTCFDQLPPAQNLTWTDNCSPGGQATVVEGGNADLCNGGIITRLWEAMDGCGNIATHTQFINIFPPPQAVYLAAPTDITVSCEMVPLFPPQLAYTNSANGACDITGFTNGQMAGAFDECGGTVFFTWNDFDNCGRPLSHTQTITVQPAADPIYINPPQDVTVSCDNIPGQPPSLLYTNFATGNCLVEGAVVPTVIDNTNNCGGNITNVWDISLNCGVNLTHTQIITIDPAPPAIFINPPTDITLSCSNFVNNPQTLNYSNGENGACAIAGSVDPVTIGTPDPCGNAITNEWTFTDNCGRTIMHSQNIIIEPALAPAFVDPPLDITITCDQLPLSPPPLEYSNGESGVCLINGFAPGNQSGSADMCGGFYQHFWDYTDACGRNISHIQNIDVLPAPPPIFINPPADITISCVTPFPTATDLNYSNSASGACEISGTASPSTVMIDAMTMEITWTFTAPCSASDQTYVQTITQSAGPDISINPTGLTLCSGEIYDLTNITVIDANGTNPTITYHDATPADNTNELSSSTISPTADVTIYILATDADGCAAELPFDITVDPAPSAGQDSSITFCFNTTTPINFFDLLAGNPDPGGTWIDVDGTGLDFSDPTNVDISGLPPGTCRYTYSIGGAGSCPLSEATVTLIILDQIQITIDQVTCSADLMSYEVTVQSNGYEITSTAGIVNDLGGGTILIDQIPVGQDISITATDVPNSCMVDFPVTAPDCNCGIVNPPTSDGDQSICENENVPLLSVTVEAGQIANWYDAASGGALLQAASNTYLPAVSAPGIYQYYVESENTIDGCISSTRTLVQLEIFALPEANNAQLELCDTDGDGFAEFDLTIAENDINNNGGISFAFYPTQIDAENQTNALSSLFTNTTPFNQTIYVRVSETNCSDIAELALIVNEQPEIQLNITNETCIGDGDGAVEIISSTAINYNLDGNPWQANNIFSGLVAGGYTAFVQDGNDCENELAFTIEPGLELTVSNFQSICDDNGSSTDPGDDSYDLSFVVNNNLGLIGSFDMTDGTTNYGSGNYGQIVNINIPAAGQSFVLDITDAAGNCSTTINIGPLNSCSTDCEIVINTLISTCNNNGTPTDPSDDFYEIQVNASGINNGSSTDFEILIGGNSMGNYAYDQNHILTVPADGSSPIVTLIDSDNNQCQIQQQIDPLIPCSTPGCSITAVLGTPICDDAGTPGDDSDDTFTISITVTAQNPPGSGWSIANIGESGVYGVIEIMGPFLISNGSISSTINDSTDPSCFTTINFDPPASCSDCNGAPMVNNATLEICDTDMDGLATFDLTTAEVDINADPTVSFTFYESLTEAINQINSISSNYTNTLAFNQTIFVRVEDMNGCAQIAELALTVFTPPDIQVVITDETCLGDNNGTATINSMLAVNYNLDGGAWEVNNNFSNLTPGNYTAFVQDANNCENQSDFVIDSGLELTVSNFMSNCNDGNSSTDPTDDIYFISFIVNNNLGQTGTFEVTSGATNYGTWNYGALVNITAFAMGQSFTIVVTDDLTNCTTDLSVGPLNPCSTDCEIIINTLTADCQDNGTPSDPSDDFYAILVNASGINNGTSNNFELLVDGSSQGVFVYDQDHTINLPADGSSPILTIQDTQDNQCQIQQQIGPLSTCSGTCVISAMTSVGPCDNAGTGDDESDDTYTFDVIVNGQNIGTSWSIASLAVTGSYGINQTIGPLLISNGPLTLTIQDDLDPMACTTTITINPPSACSNCSSTVDAGISPTINCQDTDVDLIGSSNDMGNFEWTNELGMPVGNALTTNVSQPGWYYLTGTFANNCIAVDSVLVNIDSATPVANAGPDQALDCNNNGMVTLDGTLVPFNPDINYIWTDGSGSIVSTNPIYQTSTPGIYNLQLINSANLCASALDEVEILDQTQQPLAIIFTDPDSIINCNILSVDLSTQVEPNVEYSWQVAGETFIQNQITISTPGLVNLIAIDTLTGCSNSNDINIDDFTDYPIIDINPPGFLSCDFLEVIIDANNSQTGADIIHTWYDGFGIPISGANTTTLTVEIGGFYVLESFDQTNQCTNTDTVFVESFQQMPLSEPAEDVMLPCLETSALLNYEILSPLSEVDISWTTTEGQIITGANSTNPEINGTGIYYVSVENNISGCTITDSLLVSNNPNVPEAVSVQVNDEACLDAENGNINIQGVDGGQGPYTYTLDNNLMNTSGNFSDLSPGFYSLYIEDSNGCSTDTSFIINPGVELEVEVPEIIELIENHSGQLQATVNVAQSQIAEIIWTPSENLSCDDCLNPQVTATDGPEEYLLTVIHENGCVSTATIRLLVRPDVEIFIPNSFSPNGDGQNDVFTLFANEKVVSIASMTIFDRWGAVVFKNRNFDHSNLIFGWDGKHKGQDLNPAVFVYSFEVLLDDGTVRNISGDVALIR